jgi:protein-tyrosine phosphatase
VSSLSWLGHERVAIGCLPTATTMQALAEQGVTHVVNCRSLAQTFFSQDLALEREVLGAHRVAHAPMWDHGGPQSPHLWAVAAAFAAAALGTDPNARVLIHCQQGRRRSAMVAYAVLRLRGHSGGAAAALIAQYRVESELVPAYVESVEGWLRSRD